MSTYAVLGATGMIGSACLQALFTSTDVSINCLVRSEAKLGRLTPEIASSSRVRIFQGDITNIDVLTDCLVGTSAVFLCVACSHNTPGVRIAQDQVLSVAAALSRVRSSNPHQRLPRLLLLSSAEVEKVRHLNRNTPWLVCCFLYQCSSYVYEDLMLAETYLREQKWLNCVFVKPGGLSHDAPSGHKISEEEQQTFLSLDDLATGMVELAEEHEGRWDGKDVSVVSKTGKLAKVETRAIPGLLKGFVVHWFPWSYPWLF